MKHKPYELALWAALPMAHTTRIEGRLEMILDQTRPRRALTRRSLLTSGVVCISLLGILSGVRFTARAAGPPPTPPTVLPNGVALRLVGVGDPQASGARLWRTDGSPAEGALPKSNLTYTPLPSGAYWRTFSVSASYDSAAQPQAVWTRRPNFGWRNPSLGERGRAYSRPVYQWEFEPNPSLTAASYEELPGPQGGTHRSFLLSLPLASLPATRKVTLKLGVAAGPWTEEVTCPRPSGTAEIQSASGAVVFRLIPSAGGPRGSGFLRVTDHFGTAQHSHFIDTNNYDRKIVALDKAGHVLYDVGGATGPAVGGGIISWADVPRTVLARTVAFRLSARPFQWAEFKDIALQPKS